MFVLPGLLGLLVFIFARPTDFIPALKGLPLLYVFFGLCVVGYLIDVRLGLLKAKLTPVLKASLLFFGWCMFTTVVKARHNLVHGALELTILVVLLFLVSQGIRGFRAFETLAITLFACTVFISAVCVHQGFQPFQCIEIDDISAPNLSGGTPDGRSCDREHPCELNAPKPDAFYQCERAGLFGISSVGKGRVRYTGVLHDPNEVALTVSIVLPIGFALAARRRRRKRWRVFSIIATILSAMTVIFSQSRGGLLVFMSVLGVYLFRRYRFKGVIAAGIAGLPVLLLGGRSGAEASASSNERLECWYAGMDMWRQSPVMGVGFDQFLDYHFLTAHNSFVLAPAELGIVGFFLWSSVLYLSFRSCWLVFKVANTPESEVARTWALAMLASLVGLTVGVFFLSFNYHYVFWIYIGMAAALFIATRAHVPELKLNLRLRDFVYVLIADVAIVALLFTYTRIKVG